MSEEQQPKKEIEDNPIFIISIMCGIFLLVGGMMYFMHQFDTSNEARHKKNQETCNSMGIKFGDTLTAKEGFYKGVPMLATGQGYETFEVQVMEGLEFKTLRFDCADLMKVLK